MVTKLEVDHLSTTAVNDLAGWQQSIGSGIGFLEGPVWTSRDSGFMVSTDSGLIFGWTGSEVRLSAVAGGGPNGATAGANGELYIAQNGGHGNASRYWPGVTGGVQVLTAVGRIGWLTQDPISPNDLCFGPDGMLYVTDPTRSPHHDDSRIWRCDPGTGETEIIATMAWYANGIGFGPDGALYIANTFERSILRYDWKSRERLSRPDIFVQLDRGLPDGFAFDTAGNLLIAAIGTDGASGDIPVVDPSGRVVERLELGTSREYTNIAIAPDGQLAVTDATTGELLIARGWPHGGRPLHIPN